MEDQVFSVKDLAQRWNLSEGSILGRVYSGELTPIGGVNKLKKRQDKYIFSLAEVERIERESNRPRQARGSSRRLSA